MNEENWKNSLKIVIIIVMCIVSLFIEKIGKYWSVFLINFRLYPILYFIVLLILLTLAGVILVPNLLGKGSLELIKQIPIMDAIKNYDKLTLFIFFPLTMLFEELLFRGFLLGSLIEFAGFDIFYAILLSSIIFGLYHIHIWFAFKNLRMTYVFILYSFVLGIFCGLVFPIYGILGCMLFHYINVFAIYLRINKIKEKF